MSDQIEAPAGSPPPVAAEEPRFAFLNEDPALEKNLSQVFKSSDVKTDEPEPKEEPAPKEKEEPAEKPKIPVEEARPPVKEPETAPEKEVPVKEDGVPPRPDEIKPPQNVGNRSLEGWNALHSNYKRVFNLAKAKDDEVKKLKNALAEKDQGVNQTTEKFQKEIDELRGYRLMVDAQHDPEFQKTYDAPLDELKVELSGILERVGVSKDVIAHLDFSNAELMDQIALQIEDKRDRITSKRFLTKSEDFIKLADKRTAALEDNRKRFKELSADREKRQFEQNALQQGAIANHIQRLAAIKTKDGKEAQFPFLVKKEAPLGASQGEVQVVDSHNALVDMMNKNLEAILGINTPEEKAEVAVAAISASWYARQLKSALGKVEKLEAELSKVSNAGSERRPTGGAPSKPASLDMNAADALSAHFPNHR